MKKKTNLKDNSHNDAKFASIDDWESSIAATTKKKENDLNDHGISSMLEDDWGDNTAQPKEELPHPQQHLMDELGRVQEDIKSGNITSKTMIGLKYVMENLKSIQKSSAENKDVQEPQDDVSAN